MCRRARSQCLKRVSGLLKAGKAEGPLSTVPDGFGWYRLQPPFNNLEMRRAMLLVVNQAGFMTASAGDPKHWNVCASFFTCRGPMANEDGLQVLPARAISRRRSG